MDFDAPAKAQYSAEEIMAIACGRLAAGLMPDAVGAICSDTRELMEGDWFLALPGRKFDGHDFLGDAFSQGAVGAIVAERANYPIGNQQFPLIAVGDTRSAFLALAANWRRRINPTVIAVAGNLRRLTAVMCQEIFAQDFACHSSPQAVLDEVCLPGTILSMPDDTRLLILELLAGSSDQMSLLAHCAQPDIAIITDEGDREAHTSFSAETPGEIYCQLLCQLKKERGQAIIGHGSDEFLKAAADVCAGKLLICREADILPVLSSEEVTVFRLAGRDTTFEVKGKSEAVLQSAWCAIMAGAAVGLSDQKIASGLKRAYLPPSLPEGPAG